ncbi:MAG TPA: hypothetical protein VIQ03_00905 [Gammaproteobacteria bacterium]
MIKNEFHIVKVSQVCFHTLYSITACFFAISAITTPAFASSQPTITGGATVTHITSSDDRINSEATASVDLILSWQVGKDEIYTYIEANNSPKANGVSSFLPEANADAGSALDKDLDGRIQISEIGYRHFIDDSQTFTFGLIDVTAYFDQSRIASDENSQFLGVSFVQNPTIEFPDYTLGMVYENTFNQHTAFRAALTASNGIADNSNLSYAQLVDVDNEDKGAFSILSLSHKTERWLFRGGMWTHTAPHDSLNTTQQNLKNYGAYFLSGYKINNHGINLRLGQSNERVSLAHGFAGLSYQYRKTPYALGAGAAKIFVSDDDPGGVGKDTLHYETYFRYRMNEYFFITADMQYLINSNFDASDITRDHRQKLYGLRLTFVVE